MRLWDDDPRHAVFVAEDRGVVGWIHVQLDFGLVSSGVAEVGGLVVDERNRRGGIATALVARAQEWAQDRGCRELVVRSNTRRREAHEFYPALGFEPVKEQRVYRKRIG